LLLWYEKEQEEQPWLLAAYRSTLGQVALELQQEKRSTASREEIEAAIEAVLPPPEERTARATAHVFGTLTGEQGLLRPAGSDRWVFAHPLWQAYLTARQLAAVDPTSLVERLEDPHWSDVLRFYAELGDMGPLVAAWLRSPLQTAPIAPTRRALAKALAATGVPGVAYLLKQALQHPDAEFRAAAVLGLADVAGEADLPAFETPLEDDDPAVREAAVRGLASLGIDAATRRLEQVLLEGDDTLRPIAAELLVKCGEENVDLLHEMVESEDMMARRAAVSGLKEEGARGLLEKMAREDEQWIVRSAATTALEEMEKKENISGIAPVPEVEQLPWLISWAAAQGEGVGLGEAAQQMLRRALREGDDSVRMAAVQVLTQIGHPDDVGLLRAALADPDPVVMGAAFEALAEISRRYDLTIEQEASG
jgi:HEAT repeat protein